MHVKGDALRELGRPLFVLGVAVVCSCTEPAALPGVGHGAGSAAVKTPSRKHARNYTPTSFGRTAGEKKTPGRGRPVTTGHTVFGPLDKLQYFGGRVISNVNVVAVDWTSAVDPAISSYLPGFFTTVTASAYFTWLVEYDTVGLVAAGDGLPGSNQTIGYGTFDDTYVITPTLATTTTVDDSGVREELAAQLAAGNLPAPVQDGAGNVNSLYVFDFPAGYTVTLDGMTSCEQFCGYHGTISYGSSSSSVPYAVLLDMGPSSPCHTGCGTSKSYVDNSTSVHSHELIEAITDTEVGLDIGPSGRPLAWYDEATAGGESADLCNEDQAEVGGYTVQAIWSNANGACIAVAPFCNGTSSPPSCTPCTAEDEGVGCNGATPACETDPANAKFGQCVACGVDSDCPSASKPICVKSSGGADDTCRACAPADCTGDTPVCGTGGLDDGRCVQCEGAKTSACLGATPYCNTLTFVCVGCVASSDCSGDTPTCDEFSETCRACKSSVDCGASVCDTSSGACVPCLQDSDCGLLTCDASTHQCRCDASSECDNPTPTCGADKTCGECRNGGDCAESRAGDVCLAGSCVECAKSSDCREPTPDCLPTTHTCARGADRDAAAAPTPDAGKEHRDSGAADAAGEAGEAVRGGCAVAPGGDGGDAGAAALVASLGLVFSGARRRKLGRRHAAARRLS